MFEAFGNLIGALVDVLRQRPAARRVWLVVALFILASAAALAASSALFNYPAPWNAVREPAIGVGGLAGFALIIGLLSLTDIRVRGLGIEVELEPIRQERREIRERIQKEEKPDIISTIQLSLNQIAEYYTINKSQARNSFGFSVAAVVIGLGTVLAGIWLFYFGKSGNLTLAIISGIAGLISQFIGGVYFVLYSKSLSQLNFFYGQLVEMQHTMLAIRLSEDISDVNRREGMKEEIVRELLRRRASPQAPGDRPDILPRPRPKRHSKSGPPAPGESS